MRYSVYDSRLIRLILKYNRYLAPKSDPMVLAKVESATVVGVLIGFLALGVLRVDAMTGEDTILVVTSAAAVWFLYHHRRVSPLPRWRVGGWPLLILLKSLFRFVMFRASNSRAILDEERRGQSDPIPMKPHGARLIPESMEEIIIDTGLKTWSRLLDINLVAEHFIPGEMVTLTVALLLPTSKPRGRYQKVVEVQAAPAHISVQARGFEVVSEDPGPIALPPDRDSPLVAFQLLILESSERWIHVIISQGGVITGEYVVNDFSAFQEGMRIKDRSPLQPVETADLTLEIDAVGHTLRAYSPPERASLYGTPLGELRSLPHDSRTRLRQRLKALYNSSSDASGTERELKLIGVDLAKCLPADLTILLRRSDIKTVMLRHDDECDFPFELVYIDDKADPFFVGDRISICRWYLGVRCPPYVTSKTIRKVAVLVGKANASNVDRVMLGEIFPGMATPIQRHADVINLVFKTKEFDVIHFTGHCSVNEEGQGGLQLADGSFLGMRDIGQLEEERQFSEAQPFVVLNACASGQPYAALIERDSFAHRFVTSRACAFVGTLWPVDGSVANNFARRFYGHLRAGKTISSSVLLAKAELVGAAAEELTASMSDVQRLATRVAIRSYCVFANPDLRLVQPQEVIAENG